MSIAVFALPLESTVPLVRPFFTTLGVAIVALRPLLGFGIFAALLWLFKPLARGLARAGVMLFKPRHTLEERNERRTLRSIVALNRMARELDTQQPNLAAELRLLAARG